MTKALLRVTANFGQTRRPVFGLLPDWVGRDLRRQPTRTDHGRATGACSPNTDVQMLAIGGTRFQVAWSGHVRLD